MINPHSFESVIQILGGTLVSGDKLEPPKFSGSLLKLKRLGTAQAYSRQVFHKS